MARLVELPARQCEGGNVFVNPDNVTFIERAEKANLALHRHGGDPVVLHFDADRICVVDGPIEDVVRKLNG